MLHWVWADLSISTSWPVLSGSCRSIIVVCIATILSSSCLLVCEMMSLSFLAIDISAVDCWIFSSRALHDALLQMFFVRDVYLMLACECVRVHLRVLRLRACVRALDDLTSVWPIILHESTCLCRRASGETCPLPSSGRPMRGSLRESVRGKLPNE
jgi:hypothetical protein